MFGGVELDLVFLCVASVFAGVIDAMVGGGGLIQVPALLLTYHDSPLATLFGTNKTAAASGTALSAYRYVKEVSTPKPVALVSALSAFIGAFVGALCVSCLNPVVLRPVVILLLCGVATYTVCRPKLGSYSETRSEVNYWICKSVMLGGGVGFYDGFFGPGTGAFLLFGFVSLFHYNFLVASGLAKIVNLTSNVAALSFFIPSGSIIVLPAIVMALGHCIGSYIGTSLAIRRGAEFVRLVFLCVVTALTVRLSVVWFG